MKILRDIESSLKFTYTAIIFEWAEFIKNLYKKKILKSLNRRDLGKYVGNSQVGFEGFPLFQNIKCGFLLCVVVGSTARLTPETQ